MNPLSAKKYITNNIKKVAGQVVSLALGVSIIFFIFAIGGGFLNIMSRAHESNFDDKVMLLPKGKNSMEKLQMCYDELIESTGVDKVLEFEYSYSSVKTILGITGCNVNGLSREDIKYIFSRENYNLIEGTMPESNDEMIASEEYVKANGYKIDDYIGNEVSDVEGLIGKKKLVGIFKGDEITAYYLNENIKNKCYLVLVNNSDEVQKITDRYDKEVSVIDKSTDAVFMSTLKTSLKSFGVFITVFMVIIEWIILNNLIYINLFSRRGELSLLYAIGQSDKKIRKMILAEQGAIIFMGFLLGAFIGIIGTIFFNSSYLEGVGQKIPIFSPWYLVGGFILSLMMILTSRLPLRKFFKKVDRVVVLEGS